MMQAITPTKYFSPMGFPIKISPGVSTYFAKHNICVAKYFVLFFVLKTIKKIYLVPFLHDDDGWCLPYFFSKIVSFFEKFELRCHFSLQIKWFNFCWSTVDMKEAGNTLLLRFLKSFPGIPSEIFIGILPGISQLIPPGIPSEIHSGIPSEIHSRISPEILAGIPPGISLGIPPSIPPWNPSRNSSCNSFWNSS